MKQHNKNTMLDYLDWRGDLPFTLDKLNEVDCLIFSTLSYMDMSGADFADTANPYSAPTLSKVYSEIKNIKCFGSMFLPLFKKCAMSARFKNTKVMFYRQITDIEQQTQFSAVTFVLENSDVVIAFRGTDDTLVGWQEDINMALGTIPAQKHARRYLCEVAETIADKPLYVAGHSKGGNLAVWASAYLYSEYQDRLKKVYDFDGPGFSGDFVESDEYKQVIPKTTKFVVDASIIGMLLSSETEQIVVESVKHNSMLQHLTNTWMVLGTRLCYLRTRSDRGLNAQVVVDELIESLSFEERKQFASMLSDIVESSDIKGLYELRSIDAIPKVFDTIKNSVVKEEDKKLVQSIIKRTAVIIKNNTLSRTGLDEFKEKSKNKLSDGRQMIESLKEKGQGTLAKIQRKK